MTIRDIITILISAILIENVLLSQFLGVCSFLGVSKSRKNAVGMGVSVVAVILIATIVTWVIYNYVLVTLDLMYLRTIVFILVIASLVQIIEILIKKFVPALYKSLGIYLPLITTNCAVLGVALKAVNNDLTFVNMLLYAFGSGIGFLLVMYIFSLLREELDKRNVPQAMKGVPIALVVAAILAILFSRYVGISPKEKEEKAAPSNNTYIIEGSSPSEENFNNNVGDYL